MRKGKQNPLPQKSRLSQVVKTPPSQGGDTGSTPVGVTNMAVEPCTMRVTWLSSGSSGWTRFESASLAPAIGGYIYIAHNSLRLGNQINRPSES